MSVFQNEMGGMGYEPVKSLQPYKRNYEKEIARKRSAKQASQVLSSAIEEYIKCHGKGNRQFTLTSLYGALLLEQKDLEASVEHLQEQWESDR